MEKIFELAAPVFMLLVFLTNMITEALKKIKEDINPKAVALITAIIMSIITALTAGFYFEFTIWYLWLGLVVVGVILGFVVAQVAESGYDGAYMKLIEILKVIVKAVLGAKEVPVAEAEKKK